MADAFSSVLYHKCHHVIAVCVTDAKLKRQTETATATRESSDIHTNTL